MTDETTDVPMAPEPADGASVEADEAIGDATDPVTKPKKKGKKKRKKTVVVEVVPTWVRWTAVLAAAIVVALAAVAVGQSGRVDDLKGEANDRKAAERVAGEFSETLFTFDSGTPAANLDRLKELATNAYKPKVDEARQTALAGSSDGQEQASMTARVTDVYLTELEGSTAHAVTRAQWLLNVGDQTLTLDLYLQMDLKQEGGRWKVDTVSAITAKQPAGATTTTTPTASTPTTSVDTTVVGEPAP